MRRAQGIPHTLESTAFSLGGIGAGNVSLVGGTLQLNELRVHETVVAHDLRLHAGESFTATQEAP